MVGNRITSRMESVPQSIMAQRSMPKPRPPVGGMPYSRASDEVLVHHVGLIVAVGTLFGLGLEALLLVDGVVQLGEGVAHLAAADEHLIALGKLAGRRGCAWPGG